MVDRNGMRGGAAISAVVLLLGWILFYNSEVAGAIVTGLVAAALGTGSIFGPRRSLLGVAYLAIKKTFGLRIPVEPEPAAPPRFAQTLGFVFTAAATVSIALGAVAVGWALGLIVAALQALLAATGICIGCEMYLLGKRFAARGA